MEQKLPDSQSRRSRVEVWWCFIAAIVQIMKDPRLLCTTLLHPRQQRVSPCHRQFWRSISDFWTELRSTRNLLNTARRLLNNVRQSSIKLSSFSWSCFMYFCTTSSFCVGDHLENFSHYLQPAGICLTVLQSYRNLHQHFLLLTTLHFPLHHHLQPANHHQRRHLLLFVHLRLQHLHCHQPLRQL